MGTYRKIPTGTHTKKEPEKNLFSKSVNVLTRIVALRVLFLYQFWNQKVWAHLQYNWQIFYIVHILWRHSKSPDEDTCQDWNKSDCFPDSDTVQIPLHRTSIPAFWSPQMQRSNQKVKNHYMHMFSGTYDWCLLNFPHIIPIKPSVNLVMRLFDIMLTDYTGNFPQT